MKTKALDQIDTNLEQIITKLTEAGKSNGSINPDNPEAGSLPPLEFGALKLAQETLNLLRIERKTEKRL